MALRKRIGVEGLWNTKKESLKQLQDRLSKTPTSQRSGSSDSERIKLSPQLGGDLRRGQKPPIPPVPRRTSSKSRDNRDSSLESASISSDEVEYISSPPTHSHRKKRDKDVRSKKAHRVSLAITPQPPTVFFAPPPMQPLYAMPPTMPYTIPFFGMPQQPMAVPVPTVLGGQIPATKPKKSSMKDKSSDQDDEGSVRIVRSRRRKAKRVRIMDEKDAVDAGTSTDEVGSTGSSAAANRNKEKDLKTDTVKNEPIPISIPPLMLTASINNKQEATTDWDAFFAPRMAPPLLFADPDNHLDTLSMVSNNTVKQQPQSATSFSNVGQLTIETSSAPAAFVYQPPARRELDSASSGSSPVPKLTEDDRTLAWLASDQTSTTIKVSEQKRAKKLTPIAEEVLRSYEKLKSEQYDDNTVGEDPNLDGELASANRRLARYFNQLRDLDHFILDQEGKLLDREHHHVEKKVTEIKPIKTVSISPRPRHTLQDFRIASPQAPPPKTPPPPVVAPVISAPRTSALLIEELYSHLDQSKDKVQEAKPVIEEEKEKPSSHFHRQKEREEEKSPTTPKHKRGSIYDRFTTNRRFSNYLFDAIFDDLLDELLTFEVGRAMQAASVEAVSAMIEKKLAEDLEEKRAMTRKIIERLPSPTEVIEKAMQQTEATVQRIVEEATVVPTVDPTITKKTGSTTPVEDVDLFFRELTLPKAAEAVVKDVLEVDLKVLAKEVMLELSIESVVDDFLINQVVANEMLKLSAEALGEVDRRKKRSRRRQMKDALQGPVLNSMILDVCLAQIAQQSLILSPNYEADVCLYDSLLQALLGKTLVTLNTRAMVAECLPMRRYHEKVVSDIAMDAVVNELIKSLDIDMAEVDDFETGRDFDFSNKTPPPYFSLNNNHRSLNY